jgi:hypothetical protein
MIVAFYDSFENCFWNIAIYLSVFITFFVGIIHDSSWFCYSLIIIIWEIPLARDIIYAVKDNVDKLIITIILASIFLYWFTVMGYNSSWNGKYNFGISIVFFYFYF